MNQVRYISLLSLTCCDAVAFPCVCLQSAQFRLQHGPRNQLLQEQLNLVLFGISL
jgi:hypothetical protein